MHQNLLDLMTISFRIQEQNEKLRKVCLVRLKHWFELGITHYEGTAVLAQNRQGFVIRSLLSIQNRLRIVMTH